MQLVHVEALSVASDVDGVVGPLLYWGVVLLIVQVDPGLIVVGAIEMPGRGEAVDLAGADHVVVDPFTSAILEGVCGNQLLCVAGLKERSDAVVVDVGTVIEGLVWGLDTGELTLVETVIGALLGLVVEVLSQEREAVLLRLFGLFV